MHTETVIALASGEGKALIEEASELVGGRCEAARALTKLRKTGKNAELAAAAWEIALLQPRALAKLGPIASKLLMDRDGYEMASSHNCSSYHADILRGMGASHIIDACAGLGIDSLAFAAAGMTVTAYEVDPVRAEMARRNAAALGFAERIDVRCEDVTAAKLPRDATAIFFDPARRADKRRLYDPEALLPPLSFVRSVIASGIDRALVKLAPSTDRNLGSAYGGAIEYISDGGECKEALLIIGDTARQSGVSAVILPGLTLISAANTKPVIDNRIGSHLYEPDPAVIRAGLVGETSAAVNGWLLDADVAYIFSDSRADLPYARRYAIIESMPFHIKHLQAALNRLDAGRVVVKKRAVDIEPEELARMLKLSGSRELTVILMRSGKSRLCLIATPESGLVE